MKPIHPSPSTTKAIPLSNNGNVVIASSVEVSFDSIKGDRPDYGYVYIVETDDGLTKIGNSRQPVERIHSLLTHGGKKLLRVALTIPHMNYSNTEKVLLTKTKAFQKQISEWRTLGFDAIIEILKEISVFVEDETEYEERTAKSDIKFKNFVDAYFTDPMSTGIFYVR